MDTNQTNTTKREEIDLLFILRSLKQGIAGLFNGILRLIDFSVRNIVVLAAFVLVAAGIGLGISYKMRPYYKSELSISHNRLDNYYCAIMIENLNFMIDPGSDNEALAKTLHMDKKDAKEIRQLIYKPLNTNVAKQYSDSLKVLIPFKVEAEVYSNSVLPALQKGIMDYLESNEHAQRIKEIEMKSLEKIESKIQDEVKEIDSLKQIVNQSIVTRGTGNGVVYGEAVDPVPIYNRGMLSYERLIGINTRKIMNNSFEVMVGFNASYIVSHSRQWYILMGGLAGYLAGLLFLMRKKRIS